MNDYATLTTVFFLIDVNGRVSQAQDIKLNYMILFPQSGKHCNKWIAKLFGQAAVSSPLNVGYFQFLSVKLRYKVMPFCKSVRMD